VIRPPKAKSLLVTVAAALGFGSIASVATATEEPQYTVVQQHKGIEVRSYAPYLVAEVVVPGPADAAGNQGFRILAAYIFGKNKGERRIQMTAPVTQAPECQRSAYWSHFVIGMKEPGRDRHNGSTW